MDPEIGELYGNKVRIRSCGLCWREDRLLMVRHGFGKKDFWAPPGGGIEFGESVHSALTREFLEETGFEIRVKEFRFSCEFLKPPLHAIELFFDVEWVAGELTRGHDPELNIIKDVQFLDFDQLSRISKDELHGIIAKCPNAETLRHLSGFYSI